MVKKKYVKKSNLQDNVAQEEILKNLFKYEKIFMINLQKSLLGLIEIQQIKKRNTSCFWNSKCDRRKEPKKLEICSYSTASCIVLYYIFNLLINSEQVDISISHALLKCKSLLSTT